MTGGTMSRQTTQGTSLTVGQVADELGVTVRTLHHYDAIGLLTPSGRTPAGYRLYTAVDLVRLQHVVVYRRLGFSLEEIAELLDADDGDVRTHLQRQRDTVVARLSAMHDLVDAIDRALEKEESGMKLTTQEQKELFGGPFAEHQEEYAAEAEQRWGDTNAWKQSNARTKEYTKGDWEAINGEQDKVNAGFLAALRTGALATSDAAAEAAEAHRRHISRWFYDVPLAMHRGLGDMYVSDPRFTATYEEQATGLASYVRDAIHANADRRDAAGGA